MKKIFTIIALFACSMAAVMAKDYTNTLTVNINGTDCPPQNAVISVDEQEAGKYTLQLKNFILDQGEDGIMPVGNITISDVEGTTEDGVTTLTAEKEAVITAGDDLPGVDFWYGTILPSPPVTLNAKIKGDNLTATIDISLSMLGPNNTIKVTFGDTAAGITAVKGNGKAGIVGIYDLTGHSVSTMTAGKVYIVKYADGKAVKTIKR